MQERELRDMIGRVKAGSLSRREFVQGMMALGLTAPLAAQMLASAGVAQAQPKGAMFTPTKRGGGGRSRCCGGRRRRSSTRTSPPAPRTRTARASSTSRSPPTIRTATSSRCSPPRSHRVQNGGVARDGRSVTWKLKKGVTWHDGKPFTADDVVFNWEFVRDPKTAARTIGSYTDIEKIDVLDSHTVRLVVQEGGRRSGVRPSAACDGMIIPKHLFEAYKGEKSREAPNNLKPVGTGPYKFVDFKPGDIVRGDINPNYHVPNRPFFDSIEMKGGGDAVSAARAVIQTGEYDYAWNMQVEDEILKRFEQGGKRQGRHRHRRQHGAHPAQQHRPVDRGGRRALQPQDQAPLPDRPRGAPGAQPAGGPGLDPGADLRAHRRSPPRTS